MNHIIPKIIKSGVITLALMGFFVCFQNAQALANDRYVPLAPVPGTTLGTCNVPDPTNLNCQTDLKIYISGGFKVALAAAGVLAFLMIVVGGFQYMSSDAITGKSEGKEKIMGALGGLLLAFVAFLILKTINPQLIELDFIYGNADRATNTPIDTDYIGSQLDILRVQDKINEDFNARRQQIQAETDPVRREQLRIASSAITLIDQKMVTALRAIPYGEFYDNELRTRMYSEIAQTAINEANTLRAQGNTELANQVWQKAIDARSAIDRELEERAERDQQQRNSNQIVN